MSDLFIRFLLVKEVLEDFEHELKLEKKPLFRKTEKGYWGTSNVYDLFDFFQKVHLEKHKRFLDLGSGDGRMVFIASLFTKATGIEFDRELYDQSMRLRRIITARNIPPSRCELIRGDFTQHDLGKYDFVMTYYDKPFTREFEDQIRKEFRGEFYIYNNIYLPNELKKGKTVWIGQMPVIRFETK